MNIKDKYKVLLSEILLISSLMSVASYKNDKALEENLKSKLMTKRIYHELSYDVNDYKKLVGFAEDGSFIFDEFTTVDYIAPSGYKIDYVNQIAYKDIIVSGENVHSDEIYERKVLSNNTNCILNIGLGSYLIYLFNNKSKYMQKRLK